jgi:phospholipid transport system substrate-binding protein
MVKSISKTCFRAGLALVVAAAVAPGLRAQSPLEVVRASNRAVLDITASHETFDDDAEEKINAVMDGVTDFGEISRRTLETVCRELSETQCGEFRRTFEALLRISSVKKLGRYRADRFEYLGEEVRGDTAVVKTVAVYKGDAYDLDYHLIRAGERWMIVNYVMDGVDTVRNYQKQFLRLIKKETFSQVMSRLRKKIEEYENEKT